MPEYQENSRLVAVEQLSAGFCRLTLQAPKIAAAAQAGQFVMAACGASFDPLLRRPFSIHRLIGSDSLQLLIRVVGKGTALLAGLAAGDVVSMIGPLGRGFHLPQRGPVCLIGGGIGIAPLLMLADRLKAAGRLAEGSTVLLGSRTATELTRLVTEFTALGCRVATATDDGSLGHHGLIIDLVDDALIGMEHAYTCGPQQMMAGVARRCMERAIPCEASLEAHMACGLGACLGCTIHGTEVAYRHVCKHGPVFRVEEVAWRH